MGTFPIDIRTLGAAIKALADDVAAAYTASGRPPGADDDPNALKEAADQFLTIAYRLDDDSTAGSLSSEELTDIGDHGLTLVQSLIDWLPELGIEDQQTEVTRLLTSLALWIGRRGGGLVSLEPLVDALAQMANTSHDPAELARLSGEAGEIMEAAVPAIKHDLEKGNPGRPWRILNINRAIMATRSHDPQLMDAALQTLAQNLPEEAPRFFAEGMQQMDALDYPPEVRAVMQKYSDAWSARTLH